MPWLRYLYLASLYFARINKFPEGDMHPSKGLAVQPTTLVHASHKIPRTPTWVLPQLKAHLLAYDPNDFMSLRAAERLPAFRHPESISIPNAKPKVFRSCLRNHNLKMQTIYEDYPAKMTSKPAKLQTNAQMRVFSHSAHRRHLHK